MRRLLISLPLLGACYTYAPIDPAMIVPGMSVRARVSAGAAQQLQPLLGLADARLLSGTLIAATADTFIVEVPSVMQAEVGSSIQTLHQRISIPRAGLLELESRTLDRFKTTVVVGAAAVVIGGYVIKKAIIDPGKGTTPGGGGPPEFRPRPN